MTFQNLLSLSGKVALITGAARGLGWQIASLMSEAGAHVVLNDVNEPLLADRVAELRAAGRGASAAPFDVRDHQAAADAVGRIVAARGALDIVVSNAGNQNRKPYQDYTPGEWQAILDVHVNGSFNVTQAATKPMLERGEGRIVLISSIVATAVRGALAPYATAKGALSALTRSLASELGPQGITCNAVAPGFLATEFTKALVEDDMFDSFVRTRVPLGRWGKPEDVAPAVLFLAAPAGRYVNGHVLTVDGGILASI